jgi:pyruvate/2-oxoglutarate dehydrogenase complex dihydrolipoamide acyltransferase (E2) component
MPGTVIRVEVEPGDEIEARRPLVVLEAMKMEIPVHSPFDATVAAVHVATGTASEAARPRRAERQWGLRQRHVARQKTSAPATPRRAPKRARVVKGHRHVVQHDEEQDQIQARAGSRRASEPGLGRLLCGQLAHSTAPRKRKGEERRRVQREPIDHRRRSEKSSRRPATHRRNAKSEPGIEDPVAIHFISWPKVAYDGSAKHRRADAEELPISRLRPIHGHRDVEAEETRSTTSGSP